jgi:hypothetical protein
MFQDRTFDDPNLTQKFQVLLYCLPDCSVACKVARLRDCAMLIGEFNQLDPYVARAGFSPDLEVAGGHTLPF